jgi:hypothetical protein
MRVTTPYKTGRLGPDPCEEPMASWSKEDPQDSIFENNPFIDGFFEWMDSPEGEQYTEISQTIWALMKGVQLDARTRKVIWPDAERLDLEQSIQRIQKLHPDFPREAIEESLINWIEMDYAPETYSEAQLDELDRLTQRWIADYERKAKNSKKRTRTRYS